MRYLGCSLIVSFACAPAQAAIYKYVDPDGGVTLTDKYRPGAIKLMDTPVTVSTPSANRGKPTTSSPTPASFPKVNSATQRQRDDVRRSVLEEERDKEVKSLDAAKAALGSPAKRPQSELDKLTESIGRHRKNIEMLDKELARLR